MGAVGIEDVASRAGVLATTASRSLNGTIELPQRTRDDIEGAIWDFGRVPSPRARRLIRERSDTIALLVPDVTTPFFARLVAAVEAEAETLLPVSLVERRSVAAPIRSVPATANREEESQWPPS